LIDADRVIRSPDQLAIVAQNDATTDLSELRHPQLRHRGADGKKSTVCPRQSAAHTAAADAHNVNESAKVVLEDPTCALPNELQTDQDQEQINRSVEAFARNAADQQHAKPGCEHGKR
jgi:hypothetical protein